MTQHAHVLVNLSHITLVPHLHLSEPVVLPKGGFLFSLPSQNCLEEKEDKVSNQDENAAEKVDVINCLLCPFVFNTLQKSKNKNTEERYQQNPSIHLAVA